MAERASAAPEGRSRREPPLDMAALKRREAAAWAERDKWSAAYNDAFRWIMPFRRKASSNAAEDLNHLFDTTAVVSTFNGAARLHQDLFPPGQAFFRLQDGPLIKMFEDGTAEGNSAKEAFKAQLADLSDLLAPFFTTGEWDNACAELCLDLFVGTGNMLILPGDKERPVRFVTLPLEEVALEGGPYGDVSGLFWKVRMKRRAILTAFPHGVFSEQFDEAAEKEPDGEETLRQAFYLDAPADHDDADDPPKPKHARWRFAAWIDQSEADQPVASGSSRTKPFLSPRYWRLPGAVMGQGPAIFATPIAKTLNRTMELTLKAAAMQIVGIWAYRPGGTFNPDTARVAPGQFWPMQSTGGIMGPDVTRLDTASGRMDVSNIVLQELRMQLQQILHDERLPDSGATPRSASEVMARMSRLKQNHIGAFGRLINEIVPVVVPRVVEILYDAKLITADLKIDQLLVALDVVSPMAQAMKVDRHQPAVEALQLESMVSGAQGPARRFKLDRMLPEIYRDAGVRPQWLNSETELTQIDQKIAQQAQAAAVTQAALAKPKDFAEALSPPETAAGPPPA